MKLSSIKSNNVTVNPILREEMKNQTAFQCDLNNLQFVLGKIIKNF